MNNYDGLEDRFIGWGLLIVVVAILIFVTFVVISQYSNKANIVKYKSNDYYKCLNSCKQNEKVRN
jgi:hypothetical protein